MRAKEYLELKKNEIYHYEEVRKSIYELYPLRGNKRKTEDYFNKYLFADVRQHQSEYNTGGENGGDNFEEREDEVSHRIAFRVRQEILNVISVDDSFIYAYNIIVMEKNCYNNYHKSNVCEPREVNCATDTHIEEIIGLYKEDYPKTNLADYLMDDENRYYLEQNKINLNHDENWWLTAFNIAYEVFDEVRIILFKPFEAKNIILDYTNDDKDLQQTVIGIINYLLSKYLYDLTTEQEKKIKILSSLIEEHYKNKYGSVDYREENKKLVNELNNLKIEYLEQKNIIKELENENGGKGMTTLQLSIFFNYLFDNFGLDFRNSYRTEWAELISKVSGKSAERIRKLLNLEHDEQNTKKNILLVSEYFKDLFPEITKRMLNDIK